jgi:hypothetical protein
MMWWQNGKLWNSRLDAQEAMRMRGEKGRESDFRQPHALSERRPAGTDGQRESKGARGERPSERAPRASERRAERDPSGKLDWKPKGSPSSPIAPGFSRGKPHGKPAWKPKGSFTPERQKFAAEGRGPRRSAEREGGREKRKWIPKDEYKRSQGIEAKKDKNWRPGGEHKDPRQKYKDAKKAKWGRFKQTVRKRWESKQGGKKKNE